LEAQAFDLVGQKTLALLGGQRLQAVRKFLDQNPARIDGFRAGFGGGQQVFQRKRSSALLAMT
jgi:hypothetical protein